MWVEPRPVVKTSSEVAGWMVGQLLKLEVGQPYCPDFAQGYFVDRCCTTGSKYRLLQACLDLAMEVAWFNCWLLSRIIGFLYLCFQVPRFSLQDIILSWFSSENGDAVQPSSSPRRLVQVIDGFRGRLSITCLQQGDRL